MANSQLTKAKLRNLIFAFYQENDPVVLNAGFDISGLVKFTQEKGIDIVNRMLFKKYGKAIDINAELGNAVERTNRMSQSLTTSTVIVKKEIEFRTKLVEYFQQHDPKMTNAANSKQLDAMVKFAMLNGLEKLSERLRKKYNAPIPGAGEVTTSNEKMDVDVDKNMFENAAEENKFGLDKTRLRNDLEDFYTEQEDEEQLEALDQLIDWACEIGMKEFNKKLQQLYGETLNQFLEGLGRELHYNKGDEPGAAVPEERPVPETPPKRNVPDVPSRDIPPQPPRQEIQTVEESIVVPGIEKEFDEMSDIELRMELTDFYKKHDPENLGNIEQVLGVARRLGRANLNEKLVELYNDTLTPRPVEKTITKQMQIPAAAPPVPRKPVENTMSPPTANNANSQDPMMREMATRMAQRENVTPRNIEQVVQKKRVSEPKEQIPEFLRKARKMRERIDAGEAIMRDADGTVIKVNLLINVCRNYTFDPMSGVCVHCGFASTDHVWGIKKKKW